MHEYLQKLDLGELIEGAVWDVFKKHFTIEVHECNYEDREDVPIEKGLRFVVTFKHDNLPLDEKKLFMWIVDKENMGESADSFRASQKELTAQAIELILEDILKGEVEVDKKGRVIKTNNKK